MTDADPNAWRALIATLANDTARRVYAEFVVSGESATLGTLPRRDADIFSAASPPPD